MVALSDVQLAMLMEEVASAMRAELPLVDVLRRLQQRRVGKVAGLAGQMADRLAGGQSLAASLQPLVSSTQRWLVAAAAAAEQSGNAVLIERAADRLRQRHELRRQAQLAWLYPIVLLLVAYVVASMALAPVIQAGHGRDLQWPAATVATARFLTAAGWIPLLVLIAVAGALASGRWRRGRMSRAARRALFCESLADQVESGLPEDQAVRNAAELAGETSLLNSTGITVSAPEVASVIGTARGGKPRPAQDSPAETALMLVARLRYQAAIHQHRAQRRARWHTRILPRMAVVVFGGGAILLYALFVIAPVYTQVGQW